MASWTIRPTTRGWALPMSMRRTSIDTNLPRSAAQVKVTFINLVKGNVGVGSVLEPAPPTPGPTPAPWLSSGFWLCPMRLATRAC